MPKYVVQHNLRSANWTLGEGQVLEFSEDEAAAINTDSPGVLKLKEDDPAPVKTTKRRVTKQTGAKDRAIKAGE